VLFLNSSIEFEILDLASSLFSFCSQSLFDSSLISIVIPKTMNHSHDVHPMFKTLINRHFAIAGACAVVSGIIAKVYFNGLITKRDDYYRQLEISKQRLRTEAEQRRG